MNSIAEMFNPKSVALIGASGKEGSVGRAIFMNLRSKPDCPLFPVNPVRQEVLGVPCFPSIKDVPSQVSLAVIAAPAPVVPALVRECGEAGVRGVIILSSYYLDSDPQSTALQKEIFDARRAYGMRTIGPDCLGVILPYVGLNATFFSTKPKPGKIALLSRALGDAMLEWGEDAGVGFSMFASLGAMIDVSFGDVIDFLSADYNTRSIMIHMETAGNARRFVSAARGFALRKPIVALRPGRSETGAQFLAARNGGVTGDNGVYDAVFKRIGVVRVKEAGALFNMARVLDSRRMPIGPRLAIITSAGDMGIMATDALSEMGGKLAAIGNAENADLLSPAKWRRDPPIELVGGADVGRYVNTVEACLADGGVDGIMVIYTPLAGADAVGIARAIVEISYRAAKPIIAVWMGGERAAECRRMLSRNGVPAYQTPEEAVKTYLYMYHYRRNIDLLYETPAEQAHRTPPLKNYLKSVVRKAVEGQRRILDDRHALDLLRNYRIPTTPAAVVTDAEDLRNGVRDMGLPLSFRIRRFQDGGEELAMALATDEDVAKAREEIGRRFAGVAARDREKATMLLQRPLDPLSPGLKLESRRDPEFGAVLAVSAHPARDQEVCIALPPLNSTLAKRFLEDAGIVSILGEGEAGQRALERLEDVVLCFSDIVVDFREIERMQLFLSVGAADVLATDAVVTLARHYGDSVPYPHLVIRPYPSHYITQWKLPDETEVILRPIRPEDESMVRDMFAGLSPETLRARFFVAPEITHNLLVRFCNVDYDRETAIIATIEKDGKKRMIGGCRLILGPDSKRAEFAILVHDDYQKMGLGVKLIDVLIGVAQENRLEEIYGEVLSENYKMLELCRKMGFTIKFGSQGVSRVSLPLTA